MSLFARHNASVAAAYEAAGNGAVLIDVRPSRERKADGAPDRGRHVPLERLDSHVDRLRGDEVYVICRSGRRSAHAASALRRQGVDAKNVKGGIMAWKREGLPLADPRSARTRRTKR